jgi:Isochorismatase family
MSHLNPHCVADRAKRRRRSTVIDLNVAAQTFNAYAPEIDAQASDTSSACGWRIQIPISIAPPDCQARDRCEPDQGRRGQQEAEVCVAFPALSALEEGYDVFTVTDASGTFGEVTRQSAWDRMSAAGAQLITLSLLKISVMAFGRGAGGTCKLSLKRPDAHSDDAGRQPPGRALSR